MTSVVATSLFVLACLAGYTFRRTWTAEGPQWVLWISGLTAAACFGVLAFVPLVY